MINPWEPSNCKTCEAKILSENNLCASCYEVEQRLPWYIATTNGLQVILEAIRAAGLSEKAYGPLLVDSVKRSLQDDE